MAAAHVNGTSIYPDDSPFQALCFLEPLLHIFLSKKCSRRKTLTPDASRKSSDGGCEAWPLGPWFTSQLRPARISPAEALRTRVSVSVSLRESVVSGFCSVVPSKGLGVSRLTLTDKQLSGSPGR